MKLNDVDANIEARLTKVKNRLKEGHGVDVRKYLDMEISKIRSRVQMIENKSGFSKQHENSEYKKLSLIIEYLTLQERKGQEGEHKGSKAEDKIGKASQKIDRDKDFKDRKSGRSGNGKKFKAPKKSKDQIAQDEKTDRLRAARLARDGQVKEGKKMNKHRFVSLMESELERSEIVMASRNIVDEIQDMVENLSKTKVEKLSPLVDRIKAEFGLNKAEQFNDSVSSQLDTALESLSSVKDAIDTASLTISGDVSPDSVEDFGRDDDLDLDDDDELDLGGDDDELDLSGDDDELDLSGDEGEIEPLDRKLKESEAGKFDIEYVENVMESRISVHLETKSGKKGKKFFESRKEMRNWLNENQGKIASILEVK